MADSRLHIDGDVSISPQSPSGNDLLRDGLDIHPEIPESANYNPTGAKLNQKRFHLAVGLRRA
jgi:hypothetical protein